MADDIMIVQSDKNRNKLNIKIRKKVNRGFSPNSYEKVLNPKDFNDLAILFEDLELLMSSPIEKAYFKYKRNRGQDFFI